MQGKTIVATGATSGIGEAAVLALAGLGARIVFVARDETRAKATMQKLEAKAPGLGHRLHLADLSSMAETRKVGAAITASEPRIDVLINNAGALFSNRRVTPEDLELTFALNHMAYFVLTEALRDRLVASAPARIVSTSSVAHDSADPRFQRPAERQGLRRAQGLRPLEARQHPVHPRTRAAPGRYWRDGQLPPSRRRQDPVRRIQRRLRWASHPVPEAVFHHSGKGRRHTHLPRILARGRRHDRRSISSSASSRSHPPRRGTTWRRSDCGSRARSWRASGLASTSHAPSADHASSAEPRAGLEEAMRPSRTSFGAVWSVAVETRLRRSSGRGRRRESVPTGRCET